MDIYINSVTGNNSNDGLTPATAKANYSGMSFGGRGPGDRLLFARGTSYTGFLGINGPTTTFNAPFYIDTYDAGLGNAKPIIQVTSGGAMSFEGLDFVVRGLDIRGVVGDSFGIYSLEGKRRFELLDCDITGFYVSFYPDVATSSPSQHLVVRGCLFQEAGGFGILGGSAHALIEKNTFLNINRTAPSGTKHAIYFTSPRAILRDVVIRHNRIIGCSTGSDGVCRGGQITTHGPLLGMEIYGNLIWPQNTNHDPDSYGISFTPGYNSAFGDPEYNDYAKVYDNRVINCGVGIVINATRHAIIRNNTVFNDINSPLSGYKYGIIAPGTAHQSESNDGRNTDLHFDGNTVWLRNATSVSRGFRLTDRTGDTPPDTNYYGLGLKVTNNIVRVEGSYGFDISPPDGVNTSIAAIANNLCFASSGWAPGAASLSAFQGAFGATGGIEADPLLILPTQGGDWFVKCQAGSPAEDASSAPYASRLSIQGYPPLGLRDIGATELGRN